MHEKQVNNFLIYCPAATSKYPQRPPWNQMLKSFKLHNPETLITLFHHRKIRLKLCMHNLFYKLLVKAIHLDTFFMKNNITKLHDRELKQSEVEPNPLIQKFLISERIFPCFQRLPKETHSTVTLMKIRSSFQLKYRWANSSYACRQILSSRRTRIWKLMEVLLFSSLLTNQSVLFRIAFT